MPNHSEDTADAALRDFARAYLANCDDYETRFQAEVARLESEGYRVVDGGQIAGYDDKDYCEVRYTDWRTSEVIVEGRERHSGELAWPDGKWYHVDRIAEDLDVPVTPPLPDGLSRKAAASFIDWLDEAATEPLVAQWLGLPAEARAL